MTALAATGLPDATPTADGALLEIEQLHVELHMEGHGLVPVVEDLTLSVRAHECLGLVGESGSGKTVTAMAILGLLQPPHARVAGSVRLAGRELLGMSRRRLASVRGREIGIVFQEPVARLDPAFTVGDQIAEVVRRHEGLGRRAAWQRAVEALERVEIADAPRRAHAYPHQLSGGMAQRVMIATALACRPKLLIADEPTTALDATIQAQVLDLLRRLQREEGMAMLFVTHDLGIVADLCDRVAVLYAGQLAELAPVDPLFDAPRHPYTEGLLLSMPQLAAQKSRLLTIPGRVPPPWAYPGGCRFHTRCAHARAGACDTAPNPLRVDAARAVRCIRADELQLRGVR
jgi:peptide/nickel transport system ATP-binding protein